MGVSSGVAGVGRSSTRDQAAGELRRIPRQHQAHVVELDQGALQGRQVLRSVVASSHPGGGGVVVAGPAPVEQVAERQRGCGTPLRVAVTE